METYRAITDGWQSLRDNHIVSTAEALVLVDPNTPSGVQPDGKTSGWQVVFSDEFTNDSLNRQKWDPWYPDTAFWNTTQPGGHKTNSNEPQAYDPSAISFEGSDMILTLRNESTIDGLPYTSGMVSSYPGFATTYGYFEARMKLPRVTGSWPAFWMFPASQQWPPEIDIMESWGGYVVGQNYHGEGSAGTGTGSTDIGSEYNTFGVLWEEGHIIWYVNGVQVFEHTHPAISSQDMILFCNLAGDKDRFPDASALPMSARVDYIRAWKAVA